MTPLPRRQFIQGSALAAALASVGACATSHGDDDGPVTFEGTGPITWVQGKDNSGGKVQARIDEWNKAHPGEEVKLIELSAEADQQRTSFINAVRINSNAYDVVSLDNVWVSEFAANRWVVELPQDELKNYDILEPVWKTGVYKDKLFAVPFHTDAPVMFYRKDFLAQAGVASRRVCEEMITEGRVTVNGEVVTELGVRVDSSKVTVQVDGMTVQTNDKLVYMAFNKPAGVVSTMEDPEGRPCISDFLRSSMSERVFHVGRLDVETEGLLLLTNDGELANRLTHPSYEVPKTYLVQVPGPMEPGVGAAMKKGIRLEDGVTRVDEFKLVDSTPGHVLVEVTIHSGKNRIVRRLFDAVGYPVERLVRVEMGPIRIGSQKQGTVRNLSKVEIGHLLASVDM